MHLDSLVLQWPKQWCLWDFLPISDSENDQFVPKPHSRIWCKEGHKCMKKAKRIHVFYCMHFKCFFFFFSSFFHQLLSNIMKLSRLLLSSQEGHPGIKLLASLGSLGSFDLILFCCFYFIYLHLPFTVTLIQVQSAPSLLLPQPQAVVTHYFLTCLNSKKWIFWTAGHLKAVLEKAVTWWVGVSLSLSIISILNEPVPHNQLQILRHNMM